MLEDDIVLKNSYYWAKRLACKSVDFNALVSIGYIVGKPLKDPRLLKDWIHFSMIKFISSEIDFRRRCIDVNDYTQNIAIAESEIKDYDKLHKCLIKAKLSKRETAVIKRVFFENKTQQVVADELLISQQSVSAYIKRAIEKISSTYLVKDITNGKSQKSHQAVTKGQRS